MDGREGTPLSSSLDQTGLCPVLILMASCAAAALKLVIFCAIQMSKTESQMKASDQVGDAPCFVGESKAVAIPWSWDGAGRGWAQLWGVAPMGNSADRVWVLRQLRRSQYPEESAPGYFVTVSTQWTRSGAETEPSLHQSPGILSSVARSF